MSSRERQPARTADAAAEPAFDSQPWLERLTEVCRALGSAAFEHRLLALLNHVVPVDHCVVFTYDEGGGAGHLFTHGKMAPERAARLADDYVREYFARDPNFARIAGGDGEDRLIPLDLHQGYDPAYRNHFFDRNDLVDKASTIGRVEHGSVYCNFYRMGSSGPYSARDWATLERMLPLATALIAAHYRLLEAGGRPARRGDRPSATSLVHNIVGQAVAPFDRLTPRERQVCERIVLGYTSVGIGLDLAIAPSSVVTYRRRAYDKLGIRSQNELFSLCLAAAQRLRS